MGNKISFVILAFIAFLIYISITTGILFIVYFFALIIALPILINIYSLINNSSNDNKPIPKLENDKKTSLPLSDNKKILNIENENILHNSVVTNKNQSNFYKIVFILSILIIFLTFITRKKIGATCNDGTSSYSTDSGTCSHHNGVRNWSYEYWWE